MMRARIYGTLLVSLFGLLTSFSTRYSITLENPPRFDSGFFDPGDYSFVIPSEPLSGTIPFNRIGNLIVIKATVDSTSGNFILDTGAPGLILNLTYFREYTQDNRRSFTPNGITGELMAGGPTIVKDLSIGVFGYSGVMADRINLGHLENAKGIKILGLLGAGLFKRFEMVIDHEKEVIHLYRFGKKEKFGSYHPNLRDHAKIIIHPIASQYGKMITEVRIGKNKLSFVLDTGAEINVVDSRLSKQVLSQVTIERRISLVGAGQSKNEAWYGSLKQLSMGSVQSNNLDVMVTSLKHLSDAYGRNIDGILGYSFLSGRIAGVNFAANELYLWK